jgi:hypothetical protein
MLVLPPIRTQLPEPSTLTKSGPYSAQDFPWREVLVAGGSSVVARQRSVWPRVVCAVACGAGIDARTIRTSTARIEVRSFHQRRFGLNKFAKLLKVWRSLAESNRSLHRERVAS